MKLKKSIFDLIWCAALVSGTGAAWLYGHPIAGIPLLCPVLLSFGIVLALFLSATTKKHQAVPEAESTCLVEATPPQVSMPTTTNVASAEVLLRYARAIEATRNVGLQQPAEQTVHLLYKRYEEVVVTHIRQPIRRLNLLDDAVHMAKQLRGTGLQVEITKDDKLLLRDLSQNASATSPELQGLSAAPTKKNDWLN